jgi:hypothetical protein
MPSSRALVLVDKLAADDRRWRVVAGLRFRAGQPRAALEASHRAHNLDVAAAVARTGRTPTWAGRGYGRV